MTEKERRKRDDEEQSRRFEETARELGADESGKKFERTFKRIVRQPSPERAQKGKSKRASLS